jgi:calcineurin-like phosphoesterase family protein
MNEINTWVISDTHFYHTNIIRYCRPRFTATPEGTEVMNKFMIDNWNSRVKPDDIVYHLGDVVFKTPQDIAANLIDSLHGIKILIRGNHDKGYQSMLDMGFAAVMEEAVIKVDRYSVLLRHRPLTNFPNHVHAVFHGHIHNATEDSLIAAGEDPSILDEPRNVNLSVEVIGYKPMKIEEALGIVKLQTKDTLWEIK